MNNLPNERNSGGSIKQSEKNQVLENCSSQKEGKKSDENNRGEWGGRIYFILTAVGCAVGLGNIWRFPYVAYENGGSAFLIPYFLSSLLIGIPILIFEMNYGQLTGSGCGTGFKKLMPVGQGIGWVMICNCFFIGCFYIMIMAYILIYLFIIVTGQGYKYVSCDNPWNTINCVSTIKDLNCITSMNKNVNDSLKAIFLNNTCYFGNNDNDIDNIRNNYFNITNGSPTSATEEFFDRYILQRTEGFENLGELNIKLFLSLTISWILILVFSLKGVKILGKISLFTSLFPYVVVIAFLIKSRELEGATEGMKYYIFEPDFSRLLDYKTWLVASTQLMFSFSIGMGNMHTLSSYNKKNHNVFVDVGVICIADVFMSIVGGAVVFSVLGFLAKKTGKMIPDVVTSGATLAFVVYPEATSLMSYSSVWAFCYFLMLFLLGVSTQVCYIDLITTGFYDSFESTRKHRPKIVFLACVLMYLCGIIFCFNGGIYYFTIFNEYTTGFNLAFITIVELLAVSVFYGVKNYIKDIRSMIGPPKNKFTAIFGPTGCLIEYCWLYISPTIVSFIAITLLYSFINDNPTYGVGEKMILLPKKAKYLGYTLTFSSLIPLILFFFINMCIYMSRGRSFKQLFKPLETWPSYGGEGKRLGGGDVETGKEIKSHSTVNNQLKKNLGSGRTRKIEDLFGKNDSFIENKTTRTKETKENFPQKLEKSLLSLKEPSSDKNNTQSLALKSTSTENTVDKKYMIK